jgi:hypothetical protein
LLDQADLVNKRGLESRDVGGMVRRALASLLHGVVGVGTDDADEVLKEGHLAQLPL